MPPPYVGGCRCGAIRYVCDVEPMFSAYCNCRDCQYASGGGFAVIAMFPGDGARFAGKATAFTSRGESGGQVTRHFCPTCGTPVWSDVESGPGWVAVKAATFDDPSWIRPAAEIWTDSAQPWANVPTTVTRFPRNPA
jgi:hypothetical protein